MSVFANACVCADVHPHMCSCMWRPDVNPQCHSSGTIYLVFLKQCPSLVLGAQHMLAWLACKSQGSSCPYPPRTGLQVHTTTLSFLCECWGWNLAHAVCSVSILLTELSQPHTCFLFCACHLFLASFHSFSHCHKIKLKHLFIFLIPGSKRDLPRG